MKCSFVWSLCCFFLLAAVSIGAEPENKSGAYPWKVGVASIRITPESPIWMAGYAARNKPSEGMVHDLHAKSLVIEDADGTKVVLLTLDLIGFPDELHGLLAKHLGQRYGIPAECLLINVSHTHSGPELRVSQAEHYEVDKERVETCCRYYEKLKNELLPKVLDEAMANLKPAEIAYSHARAGFAMNRRTPTERGVINHPYPDGPVDHEVPVLRVTSKEGKLVAVLFGYACHNTTLDFYKICGDYAGYAQAYLEASHPEAKALFMIGCGGDQNPYPRRTWELAEQHGRALANAVEAALQTKFTPVSGPLQASMVDVELEFAPAPSKEQLEKEAKSSDKYTRNHAKALLGQLEENGEIDLTLDTVVQAIRFGDSLLMLALPGETVIDYSLRFKKEFTETPLWVAGYSNNLFGYLPSLRVLKEGGYEGGDAFRYGSEPGPFSETVEDRIVEGVHKAVENVTK